VWGASDIAGVAAGEYHTVAITAGGAVWAWGRNAHGQLGDGTTLNRTTPAALADLTDAVTVAAGSLHSLAVRSDGTVWAWGYNQYGQLGDGTTANRDAPVPVAGLTGVVGVAAGTDHSMALKADGTVWAWGRNRHGKLGDGTSEDRLRPVAVVGLANVVGIAAGHEHSLALRSDGTVWAWGANWNGQLGDGTTTTRVTPAAVSGLTGAVAVASGGWHGLALLADGTVRAWGYNAYGQLGDRTKTNRTVPVAVYGLTGASAIAAGSGHSLAARSDGSVYAWGQNDAYQLGDGTTLNRTWPVGVPGLSGVFAVTGGATHTVALSSTRAASIVIPVHTTDPGSPIVLQADLVSGGAPVAGRTVAFRVDGTSVGTGVTNASGHCEALWHVPIDALHGAHPVDASCAAAPDLLPGEERGWILVEDNRAGTGTYAVARTGTITEVVALRALLRRSADLTALSGRSVRFLVDGTQVGAGVTDDAGFATYIWTITSGPTTRVIAAFFDGDVEYRPSGDTATLTARTWATKMVGFDRTAMIGARTQLKARLLRSDNVPLYNRTIGFYVDGTHIIDRPTNVDGYASYPYYDVPDGVGAGMRTILSEWPGNGGYLAISRTAALSVLKAIPYVWVLSKTVPQGDLANLYVYFRRLSDFREQAGKEVSLKIDGTWIADVLTDENGVARYLYRTTQPPGVYTVRCDFHGDAWLDPGYGEGSLTIY